MSGDCIGYPARDNEFQLPVSRYRGTTTAYQADNVWSPIGNATLKHPELQRSTGEQIVFDDYERAIVINGCFELLRCLVGRQRFEANCRRNALLRVT
jgi:hypothetical protein